MVNDQDFPKLTGGTRQRGGGLDKEGGTRQRGGDWTTSNTVVIKFYLF